MIAEGSAEKILSGKHYNRGVRFHKLMYEASMRLLWESFISWNEESPINKAIIDKALDIVSTVNAHDKLDEIIFEPILSNEKVRHLFSLFQEFCDKLRSDNGTLSQFWMSYVDLPSLLLNFIRATREGNWSLHLISVRELILWCFAYNRSNYSRHLPWYYREMTSLPQKHPDLYCYLRERRVFLPNRLRKYIW